VTKQKTYDIQWWTLVSNDQAVEQAMIALYNLQTKDEQGKHRTCHVNSKGFSSAHAKVGSMYAEKIMKGQPLTQDQIESARKIALHYVKQIVNIQQRSN
jgi:hypothetical protein